MIKLFMCLTTLACSGGPSVLKGGDGQFRGPCGLFIKGYVADSGNHCIQMLTIG